VHTLARRRVAAVIRADIAVVAIDRRVDAFAVHTPVGGAQIVVVATDATAAAILDVGIEVWVDGVAVGFVGRDSALVDFDLDEGVLLRAGAVTDRDLVVFLLGCRLGLALALSTARLPALGDHLAQAQTGDPGQQPQRPAPGRPVAKGTNDRIESLIVHVRTLHIT